MKITTTLAIAAGLAALAACKGAQENNMANAEENAMMPAENVETGNMTATNMEMNAPNEMGNAGTNVTANNVAGNY